jgi:hypothetical protein
MSEELHKNGPCTVIDGSLYDFNLNIVENLSVIIDVSGEVLTLLKYGEKEMVSEYYQLMIDRYTEVRLYDMIAGIQFISFDVETGFCDYDKMTKAKFTVDELCTLLNWMHNSISTKQFIELINSNEDFIHKKLKELSELGF